MDEYIIRETVLNAVHTVELVACNEPIRMEDIYRAIKTIPAADVRPVVHGKWLLYEGNGKRQYMCSVCCAEEKSPKVALFCYHCGAKMK